MTKSIQCPCSTRESLYVTFGISGLRPSGIKWIETKGVTCVASTLSLGCQCYQLCFAFDIQVTGNREYRAKIFKNAR